MVKLARILFGVNMAVLRLENITKKYDNADKPTIENLNLEIKDGEFIVLVGSSGCGKSTTLRMIAGLEEITGGDLYIDDVRVNDIAPNERDIAMVFQNYALYPHMSVFDNIAFPLKMQKLKKDEITKRVDDVAKILEISDLLNRKPKDLSGGQRQRVAIGRAIIREPKVLLLDEPLSNLDAELRNQMRSELLKLHDRIKATIVYVTHDQTEAMTLGDRIVVMKDGQIQQIGTPYEVYNHPVNTYVAGFIGTPKMNFFDKANLICEAGLYYVELCGIRHRLTDEQRDVLSHKQIESQSVIVGIRPSSIHIIEDGISAIVDIVESLGYESNIHFNIENNVIVGIIQNKDAQYVHGQKVSIGINIDECYLFDCKSKRNILLME